MPKMSQKRKKELSLFLNDAGRVEYNVLCRRCVHECKQPHFSCHSLRHTFTTRMCEAGVNVKVIQDTLGHSDIATTLEIYAEVTKEFKKQEFIGLNDFFVGQRTQAAP